MAKTSENNLSKEELIDQLAHVDEHIAVIATNISRHWGKDPVIYRKAKVLCEKINDLIWVVQEK